MRQWNRVVDLETAGLLALESDVGWFLVQTHSDSFQFIFDQTALNVTLCCVHHEENHICGSGHSDHLSTTSFALGRSFDDTWCVEQLNSRIVILDHTRNAGQRGESVLCSGTLGLCVFRQNGGLTDRWETYETNSCITGFLHLKTITTLSRGLRWFKKLSTKLGQLRLQSAEMVLGGLVLLCAVHLRRDLGDLLRDAHPGFFVVFFLCHAAKRGSNERVWTKMVGGLQKKKTHTHTHSMCGRLSGVWRMAFGKRRVACGEKEE
mmetsp:Transcript_42391/g.106950  ORF Transcript_42391/g.106950 Transcript_42391/m.106950 type:complete len:263 (-) Transcript_42391:71-859(-)